MTPLNSQLLTKLSLGRAPLGPILLGFSAAVLLGCGSRTSFDNPSVDTPSVNATGPVQIAGPDKSTGSVSSVSSNEVSPRKATSLQVEVTVTGFEGRSGKCRIAAYDTAQGFNDPEKAFAREVLSIEGDSVKWTFSIPFSEDPSTPLRLAISAYQDRNDSATLDKNVLGIPTERYGFSNNPKRGYGPPKFEQAAVSQPEPASASEPWMIPVTIQ